MEPMSDYTILNLEAVEDAAAKHGMAGTSVRFPRTAVGAERTGFAHQRLAPNTRQSFGHRHSDAEEVYFVISGAGSVKLDDDVRDLRTHDILRVAPRVMRCFEAGPEGLEMLAFGAHHEGDGELVHGYWQG